LSNNSIQILLWLVPNSLKNESSHICNSLPRLANMGPTVYLCEKQMKIDLFGSLVHISFNLIYYRISSNKRTGVRPYKGKINEKWELIEFLINYFFKKKN
jgi:hypothetical protein